MPDYGTKVADKAIASTAKQVRSIYRKAGRQIQENLREFTARFAAQDSEKQALLKAGQITQADYDAWRNRQIFRQKQWKDKLDQTNRIIADANNEAAQIVQKGRINVFAENYNHEAFQLEKRTQGVVNFNLYDDQSVARLIRDNPKALPEWKINEKKDYRWNKKKVNNSITQGIIQGKGIDEITKDLTGQLCTQNENRMRTFARTAITGAQNAGRIQQMHDAEDMGIKLKKMWVATLDNRTRDAHADLDGQEVGVDEPFTVRMDDGRIEEIYFPGDPNADPALVYNCRCTLIQVYDGIDRKSVRRDMDNNLVEDMTYNEWKAMKQGK